MAYARRHTESWKTIQWTRVHKEIFRLQKRIYQAASRGDFKCVHNLQRLLLRSWSARCLAVRQVSQDNRGKHTPGVDGVASLSPRERCQMVSRLLDLECRPDPMLLLNMLALLSYSLLERQVRQSGLHMTTRRIIEKLQSLDVVETLCWDGSRLFRVVPVDEEQAALLRCLALILAELRLPLPHYSQIPAGSASLFALPPPMNWSLVL